MSVDDRKPLAGVTVLVTRPAAQAERLSALIEAEGGIPLRLPLFAIEPAVDPANARQCLAGGHDVWIFTSVNAARHAAPLISGSWPPRVAAVGAATAAALATAPDVSQPIGGSSSEALLALPEFAEISGRRILIVTGEGGRRILEEGLARRGARVERAEVYRRVPLPHPPQAVETSVRKAGVLVATSGEALERLVQLAPPDVQSLLRRRPLVLPSARVVEMALGLGFKRPLSIDGPMSDAALCAACISARDSR